MNLAKQKGCQILEGHLMPDHIHMCIKYTAEIFGIACNRLHQGEKRDIDSAAIYGESKKLYGRKFLGTRLFCINSRIG